MFNYDNRNSSVNEKNSSLSLQINRKYFAFENSSMLYNRSNTLKSLEWVIMDEIHYLNDADVCFENEIWNLFLIFTY